MAAYAKQTSVPVAASKMEIERMVVAAGGTRFGSMTEKEKVFVFFELKERRLMFELPLPQKSQFTHRVSRGWKYAVAASTQEKMLEQATRARWRALVLALKAKLVSVESGVEAFEEAFLGQIVVPGKNGGTDRFVNVATRAIKQAYDGGLLPPLLGSGE